MTSVEIRAVPLACVGVVVMVSALAQGVPPRYTVQLIEPLIPERGTSATRVNELGVVLGMQINEDTGGSAAIVWDNGVTSAAPADATELNDAGLLAGSIFNIDNRFRAVRWIGGTPTYLGTLGGNWFDESAANDIHNDGTVIGWSTGGTDGLDYGFRWTDATGLVQIDELASANAINANGQIAGYNHAGQAGYLDGTTFTPVGGLSDGLTQARDLNDHLDVVGISDTINGLGSRVHAYLFTQGQTMDLGTLGGEQSYAQAVNNERDVVGFSYIQPGASSRHGFVWRDGVMWDLNNLVPHTVGITIISADDINQSGQIAATGYVGATTRGALLTPTCDADFSGDGEVNGVDVGIFLSAYAAGLPSADLDGDADTDGIDIGLFMQAFGTAC